jgi:hypothetical protein
MGAPDEFLDVLKSWFVVALAVVLGLVVLIGAGAGAVLRRLPGDDPDGRRLFALFLALLALGVAGIILWVGRR